MGQLLGLDEAPVGLDQCLKPSAFPSLEQVLARYVSNFEIPGEPESPRNIDDVRRFLFRRGVTTSGWPWNGLTPEENRKLFACAVSKGGEAVGDSVALILRGLSRIDWKP